MNQLHAEWSKQAYVALRSLRAAGVEIPGVDYELALPALREMGPAMIRLDETTTRDGDGTLLVHLKIAHDGGQDMKYPCEVRAYLQDGLGNEGQSPTWEDTSGFILKKGEDVEYELIVGQADGVRIYVDDPAVPGGQIGIICEPKD